jgi:poly(A) polymerase
MDVTKPDPKDPFHRLAGSEDWLLLDKLSNFLAGQNIESYLVGGWVRDALLGRDIADIDIAVDADAQEVAKKVAEALNGTYVLLDSENRIARVVLPSNDNREATLPGLPHHLDFSTFEGAIRQDLKRRDFTINAMAVSLNRPGKGISEAPIIDPFDGRGDLGRGVIKVVTETAFTSDALRLLRAVRLAAELGFSIDEKTESLIRQNSFLIAGVAGERVREELLRLLAVSGVEPLRRLDELNLLTTLIPEMAETKGVEQPKEHFWEVFEHSLRTVAAVDYLLRRGSREYAGGAVLAAVPWSGVLAEHFNKEVGFGSNRRSLLKLAALLHDVNKPQTKAFDANGRMRFLGHPLEGAATVVEILERLRFSGKEIKLVETEVLHHMRPGQLSSEGMPTNRAIYRYFRDTGDAGIDILFLSLADHLATRGPGLIMEGWQEHARQVEYILAKRFEQEKIVNPPKLVDGYDIIKFFKAVPGPEVGELLEMVREAQASGEITTREEALSFISERLKKKNVEKK